jgi:Arm DNA-binding domain
MFLCIHRLSTQHVAFVYTAGYTGVFDMGISRIKPLTMREVDSIVAKRPRTIKHRILGGVPGFVLVHTPAGFAGYALIYRANGKRRKLTLGSTRALSLADARKLAARHRISIESGGDPHGERLEARNLAMQAQEQLDADVMWSKYMKLAASHLRSKGEKDRIFRQHGVTEPETRCFGH